MTFIRIFISFILLTWISTAHAQIIPLGERLSNLEKNTQPKTPAPQKTPSPLNTPLSARKLPAHTALANTNSITHLSIGNYDIAGIRTGMSPEQVLQTLKSKGYVQTASERGPSFDETVKLKQKLITQKDATSALKAAKFTKNYESIVVTFLPFPSSSQLISVSYNNTDPGLTENQFNQRLKDKYGWPDKSEFIGSKHMKWSKKSKQFRGSPSGYDSDFVSSNIRRDQKELGVYAPLASTKAFESLVLEQIGPSQTTF